MNNLPPMPTVTGWFIIATAFSWLFFETYVVMKGKEPISHAMYKFGKHSMAFVFLIGFLMGHFFW